MLTKTDYLAYLDCPTHLWAHKHGRLDENSKDAFLELLIEQGYEVEQLAKEFVSKVIAYPLVSIPINSLQICV